MSQIEIQGTRFRLVGVGGGTAVHLARDERGPVGEFRTLCGRESWHLENDAVSPSCRRCLASVDAQLPDPPRSSTIDVIVGLILQALREHGNAEVLGVPGDQLGMLRRAIRKAVHQELGFSVATLVKDDLLVIMSKEAYGPHEERHLAEAMARLNDVFMDREVDPIDDSGWRFRWSTFHIS